MSEYPECERLAEAAKVELHRYEIRLHEVGLSAERRDGYLYVTGTED